MRLAEGERLVGRARAPYLAERAENGTQRQREIAGGPCKDIPFSTLNRFAVSSKPTSP